MEEKRFVENSSERSANAFWLNKRDFGAHNSSNLRLARMRSLVVSFGVLVLVLSGTIVYLARNFSMLQQHTNLDSLLSLTALGSASRAVPEPQTQTPAPAAVKNVQILVAKMRIPEGTQLKEEMFATLELPEDRAPEGAIRASDKSKVMGQFAKYAFSANGPIDEDSLAETNRSGLTPFHIPAGFRAVTITVDGRSGVEGFARPGTFVDILWFYREKNGEEKVARLIPNAKVLSVGGTTEGGQGKVLQQGSVTATILVSLSDSKVIELARNVGTLSLSLVGEEDKVGGSTALNDPVTMRDIMRKANQEEVAPVDGIMKTVDPRTGQVQKFVLSNKGWVQDSGGTSANVGALAQRNASAPAAAPVSQTPWVQQRYEPQVRAAGASVMPAEQP